MASLVCFMSLSLTYLLSLPTFFHVPSNTKKWYYSTTTTREKKHITCRIIYHILLGSNFLTWRHICRILSDYFMFILSLSRNDLSMVFPLLTCTTFIVSCYIFIMHIFYLKILLIFLYDQYSYVIFWLFGIKQGNLTCLH